MVGGGSKGLGFAVARALAGEGARVSIASRDGDAIQRAADAIAKETGIKALAMPVDLSQGDAITAWHAATVKEFGGVDLLFANTGGPPAGTALGFDDAAWQAAFELLLLSVVRTVRLVVPSMRARGGGAILVGTSSSVKEPVPNLALSNCVRASRLKSAGFAVQPNRTASASTISQPMLCRVPTYSRPGLPRPTMSFMNGHLPLVICHSRPVSGLKGPASDQ